MKYYAIVVLVIGVILLVTWCALCVAKRADEDMDKYRKPDERPGREG
jgi:hypothetical protein